MQKAIAEIPSYPNELKNIFDKEEKMTILDNNKEFLKSLILKNL